MKYKYIEIYQTPDEINILRELLNKIRNIDGEVVEVGVYAGGTAVIIREEIKNKELYLFDTYCGFPNTLTKDDPRSYFVGDCSAPKKFVEKLMKNKKNVFIVEGIFPESADIIKDKKFAFAHIDTDIYQSTKDSLEYLYPRTNKGGIILIHDYPAHDGVRIAVDDFLKDKEEKIETLGGMGRQAVITKI